MKRSDRMVLGAIVSILLVAGFWFLLLSPKRNEAAKLKDEVKAARTAAKEAETQVADAGRARREFPSLYRQVVRLGRATPSYSPDGDMARLLDQLSGIAKRTGAELGSVKLSESTAATPAAAAPSPAAGESADAGKEADKKDGEPVAGSVPNAPLGVDPAAGAAGATPTAPALIPIGARIGGAGFPLMPYSLEVTGSYFQLADFVRSLNHLVRVRNGQILSRGRLFTVDGFELSGATGSGSGLTGKFNVTTYLMNPEQGATGGATAQGPAPASSVPVSAGATTPNATEAG